MSYDPWYLPQGGMLTAAPLSDDTFRMHCLQRPSGLVLDFATAAAHLRLGDPVGTEASKQQALVESMIRAAGSQVEGYCDLALLTQQWKLSCPALGPRLLLPKAPLQSLDGVTLSGTTVDPSAYTVVPDDRLGGILVAGSSFPTNSKVPPGPADIQVTFTCGFGDPADIPNDIQQAMLLMVATWFVNRESAMAYTLNTMPDVGVKDLLADYRLEVFA